MKLNTIQYIILILLIGSVNLFSSCKDDDGHDAGSPVVVNRFYPTSGSAGTEILITGKNFSENPEDISVTLGNIPLKVLNCSMNNILAIVPPKLGGRRAYYYYCQPGTRSYYREVYLFILCGSHYVGR